jgi:hypothetical protein
MIVRHPRLKLLAACIALLALVACTVQFTPGDAKPAVYTPYPGTAASGSGGPGGQP